MEHRSSDPRSHGLGSLSSVMGSEDPFGLSSNQLGNFSDLLLHPLG